MSAFAKYHGLGNDFLLVDGTAGSVDGMAAGSRQAWGDIARALCDRHRGVGADGLIVALPGGTGAEPSGLTMLLHNADGGRVEMSGNGIRCLALFARDIGLIAGNDLVVATDAGLRQVRVDEPSGSGLAQVSVDMGHVTVGDEEVKVPDPLGGRAWRGRAVDVGNPHLVLVAEDLAELELAVLGPALEAARPGGVNVEWIRARQANHELDLRVWERGVGVTLACGTGSVAAASAAIAMGLVQGPTVLVHNPGGALEVDCSGDSAWLSGPAQRIAWLEVSPDLLAGAGSQDSAPRSDDWAVAAESSVEWHWDWARGAGWGTRYG